MNKEKCMFLTEKPDGRFLRCRILNTTECYDKLCSSYKTVEQAEEDNKKCLERLMTLPKDQQLYIKGKYKTYIPERTD